MSRKADLKRNAQKANPIAVQREETVANRALTAPTTSFEVLTVAEAAALLKVPISSIYEWTRHRGSGRGTPLPHRKVGKYIRLIKQEVEAWLLTLPQSPNTRKRAYRKSAV
jgi:excisionase family DNA binding protein